MNAQDCNSFVFYRDWCDAISLASDEEQLAIFRTLVDYAFKGKMPEDKRTFLYTILMLRQMDRDIEKWQETKSKRSEAAKNGHQARRAAVSQPAADEAVETQTAQTESAEPAVAEPAVTEPAVAEPEDMKAEKVAETVAVAAQEAAAEKTPEETEAGVRQNGDFWANLRFELKEREAEKREAQRIEAERLEAERLETQKREAERQEAIRLEEERRREEERRQEEERRREEERKREEEQRRMAERRGGEDEFDRSPNPKHDAFKVPPTLERVQEFFRENGYGSDPVLFYSTFQHMNWMLGKEKMKNWHQSAFIWDQKTGLAAHSEAARQARQGNAAAPRSFGSQAGQTSHAHQPIRCSYSGQAG